MLWMDLAAAIGRLPEGALACGNLPPIREGYGGGKWSRDFGEGMRPPCAGVATGARLMTKDPDDNSRFWLALARLIAGECIAD
jgi:hypothetical protein